jgi:UPF0271 protein
MRKSIDLNCDMGESFGAWRMGDDDAILALVSSANVACGFHAGDPATMWRTVQSAVARGVAVGAHPSLPDLAGFGRREMRITPEEVYELVVYQTGALAAFARAAGSALHHVKPHGALYNMSARDRELAAAIARAVRDFDRGLVLYGMAGSELIRAGLEAGIAVANEDFADRTYQRDGSLTPRSRPDALIDDVEVSVSQVKRMVQDGQVQAVDGTIVAMEPDTLCIHGDAPQAATFAARIRAELDAAGVAVRTIAAAAG